MTSDAHGPNGSHGPPDRPGDDRPDADVRRIVVRLADEPSAVALLDRVAAELGAAPPPGVVELEVEGLDARPGAGEGGGEGRPELPEPTELLPAAERLQAALDRLDGPLLAWASGRVDGPLLSVLLRADLLVVETGAETGARPGQREGITREEGSEGPEAPRPPAMAGAPHFWEDRPLLLPGDLPALADRLGRARALEVALTGRDVTADELVRHGGALGPVEGRRAWEAARAGSRVAQRAAVGLLRSRGGGRRGAEALERAAFALCFAEPDRDEGVAAFSERRPPRFRDGADDDTDREAGRAPDEEPGGGPDDAGDAENAESARTGDDTDTKDNAETTEDER